MRWADLEPRVCWYAYLCAEADAQFWVFKIGRSHGLISFNVIVAGVLGQWIFAGISLCLRTAAHDSTLVHLLLCQNMQRSDWIG